MTIGDILEQRAKTHGDFSEQATLSQSLKDIARSAKNWNKLEPYQKEAIDMCFHKIARALDGNCDYIDSWRDAGAYIELATKELTTKNGALDSHVLYTMNNNGNWENLK